jgi:hypothetical protein
MHPACLFLCRAKCMNYLTCGSFFSCLFIYTHNNSISLQWSSLLLLLLLKTEKKGKNSDSKYKNKR